MANRGVATAAGTFFSPVIRAISHSMPNSIEPLVSFYKGNPECCGKSCRSRDDRPRIDSLASGVDHLPPHGILRVSCTWLAHFEVHSCFPSSGGQETTNRQSSQAIPMTEPPIPPSGKNQQGQQCMLLHNNGTQWAVTVPARRYQRLRKGWAPSLRGPRWNVLIALLARPCHPRKGK